MKKLGNILIIFSIFLFVMGLLVPVYTLPSVTFFAQIPFTLYAGIVCKLSLTYKRESLLLGGLVLCMSYLSVMMDSWICFSLAIGFGIWLFILLYFSLSKYVSKN